MFKKVIAASLLALACSASFASEDAGAKADAQNAREAINNASETGKKALDAGEKAIGRTANTMSELYPDLFPKEHISGLKRQLKGAFGGLKADFDRIKPKTKARDGDQKAN